MKRPFTFIAILLFAACLSAGVRRVATSCSVCRFVGYYQQVSRAETQTTWWEKVAASVVLTRASSKRELALY